MENLLNFCANFLKSLMGAFLLNVLPNRNFGDAIAVQDLREIMYEILSDVPPPPKNNLGVAPEHIYIYIYNLVDVIVSQV